MGRTHRQLWVAVAEALILSSFAAFTRAFTLTADGVVAVSYVVVLVLLVKWSRRERLGAPPTPAKALRNSDGNVRWGWIPLAATLALITVWELFCVASLPRDDHPTLSSILNSLESTHFGRGVCFGAWLALSWPLVLR